MARSYGGIAHVWAAQTKERGKASGGRIFFEGTKIYSYGHHFMIAQFVDPTTVLLTTATYSQSTSSHQSSVRDALRGLPVDVFEVPRADGFPPDNLRKLKELFEDQLRAAARARRNAMWHVRQASRAREQHEKYGKRFWPDYTPLPEIDQQFVADAQERTNRGEELNRARWAKREELAREQREKVAQHIIKLREKYPDVIEAWRNNEQIPYQLQSDLISVGRTLLRVLKDGKTIETSRGARVPVDVAPMMWRAVCIARDRGLAQDYDGQGVRIGDFALRQIKLNGDVVIGCHEICYDELKLMAEKLGLLETEHA